MTGRRYLALLLALPVLAAAKDSCIECHSALEGKLQAPAAAFAKDVHQHQGFGCADCHGGDRNSDDPGIAMSRAKGFVGKPARTAVPQLCAKCHSDAALIHKFRPQQRVDQYAQYQTSVHGKRMAAGDTAAANCVDCHGVHDIREVKDPLSPVYPVRIPQTCSRCHADAAHMAKYKISTEQYADYRKSVHWKALEGGDLSAPSCASCHGNHGATPPQVASVANVCGTCHVMMEDLYNKSPHRAAFAAMGVAGCVTCHNNHAVLKPSSAMLAGDQAVCTGCHQNDSAGGKAAVEMAGLITRLQSALEESDQVLGRAANSGMEVSEAVLRQREAQESLVKSRVAVHAFRVAAVQEPVKAGLAIAAETRKAGENALHERDVRRIGLGIALLTIVITMAGLWLALRAVESRPPSTVEAARRWAMTFLLCLMLSLAGTGAFAMDPPESAEACGRCHRSIHEAWKTSVHARSMESRLFQDALELAESEMGGQVRRTCLGCHAPVAVRINDLALRRKVSWEGITCDYCHSIESVSTAGTNPTARIQFSLVKNGPLKEAHSTGHTTAYSEAFTSSLLCAPCHEYTDASGFPVLTTYTEWKNSRAAKEGKQCQTCHMYQVAGKVVDPRILRSEEAQINLHAMPGSHSLEQLNKTVGANLTTVREGGQLRVTVEVANKFAGHSVPTGSPLRQIVLEVAADSYGGKHYKASRVYRRAVADEHGAEVKREHLAMVKPAKLLSDTRLAAGEKRTEVFTFPVPEGTTTQVKATFTYLYSPTSDDSRQRITFLTLQKLVK